MDDPQMNINNQQNPANPLSNQNTTNPVAPQPIFGQQVAPSVLNPNSVAPTYTATVPQPNVAPAQQSAPVQQPAPLPQAVPIQSPYAAPVAPSPATLSPASLPAYHPTEPMDMSKANQRRKEAEAEESSKKKKGVKRVFLILGCAILFGIFAGVTSMGLYTYFIEPKMRAEAVSAANKAIKHGGESSGSGYSKKKSSTSVKEGEHSKTDVTVDKIDTSATYTPAQIYAANVGSTVGINTSLTVNYYGYETTAAASGSGFIISEDGYIVTNHHVIEDANDIKVTTYDGAVYDAELIGYDISDDLAVLKIDETGLTPVILGDSSNLVVGDPVMAIGNPLGELTFTLTTGCVSALKRSITINSQRMYLMQTDCAINSGNSGGPLFNEHGEVIGITSAKYSQSNLNEASIENIGFAIPINNVLDIIFSIIEDGTYVKPYIGALAEDAITSNRYDLTYGVGIRQIEEDGPAEAAGLQERDVITAINGTTVNSADEVHDFIMEAGIGGRLTLTVYRDGRTFDVEIEIGESEHSALGD